MDFKVFVITMLLTSQALNFKEGMCICECNELGLSPTMIDIVPAPDIFRAGQCNCVNIRLQEGTSGMLHCECDIDDDAMKNRLDFFPLLLAILIILKTEFRLLPSRGSGLGLFVRFQLVLLHLMCIITQTSQTFDKERLSKWLARAPLRAVPYLIHDPNPVIEHNPAVNEHNLAGIEPNPDGIELNPAVNEHNLAGIEPNPNGIELNPAIIEPNQENIEPDPEDNVPGMFADMAMAGAIDVNEHNDNVPDNNDVEMEDNYEIESVNSEDRRLVCQMLFVSQVNHLRDPDAESYASDEWLSNSEENNTENNWLSNGEENNSENNNPEHCAPFNRRGGPNFAMTLRPLPRKNYRY